jgi:cell division protein FtsX
MLKWQQYQSITLLIDNTTQVNIISKRNRINYQGVRTQ